MTYLLVLQEQKHAWNYNTHDPWRKCTKEKIHGNCFIVCPAAAIALTVSIHTREKSGLSDSFRLWFKTINVTISVARHEYANRIRNGSPDF